MISLENSPEEWSMVADLKIRSFSNALYYPNQIFGCSGGHVDELILVFVPASFTIYYLHLK